jgi:hypothetical protein
MKSMKLRVSGDVPRPLLGGMPDSDDGARSYKSGSYRPSPLDSCRLSNVERCRQQTRRGDHDATL